MRCIAAALTALIASIALFTSLPLASAESYIDSCTVIERPGYYVLAADIAVNKTKCIEIRSSDVVLDGDNHRIKAGRFGGTYAIHVYDEAGLGNITIRKLSLENWVYGVYLRDVAKVKVEGVITKGGFFGIYSTGVVDLIIESSEVSDVKKIAYGFEGVKKVELLSLKAKNSTNGILISNSADVSVCDSVVEGNGHGIFVKGSTNVTIEKSRLALNEKFGLYIYSSSNIDVSALEAIDNEFDGIKAYSSESCRIRSSTFDGNRNGIFLESAEDFRVINNRILNSETGIFVSNSKNNHFTSNELKNNRKGIVSTSSSYNLFNSNRIFGGEAVTFYESSLSTITDNWIEAEKGVLLFDSNRNLIYLNNIFSEENAYDEGEGNLWYSPKLKKGNFYSDYTGKDAYGDGIGDEDYLIPPKGVRDIYPLMKPAGVVERETVEEQTPGDQKTKTPEAKKATSSPEKVEESLISQVNFQSIEFILGLIALTIIALLIALLKKDRIL